MIVTLDVFSGLPNPSWTLSAKDDRKLISRLKGKAMAAPDAVESKLGYRGFLIAASSDVEATKAGLPSGFRIGGVPEELAAPAGFTLPVLGADEHEWVLGSQAGSYGGPEHGQSRPRYWRRAEPAEL